MCVDYGIDQLCSLIQVKQFYFFDPGMIPPPVIMVQHVKFRYNETSVSENEKLLFKTLSPDSGAHLR
jgi:hypothetical protein